jgi:hypothetical protein
LRDNFEWKKNDRVTKDMYGRHYTMKRRPVGDDSFVFESRNGRALIETTTIQRVQYDAYKAGLNSSTRGAEGTPHIAGKCATVMEGSGVPRN